MGAKSSSALFPALPKENSGKFGGKKSGKRKTDREGSGSDSDNEADPRMKIIGDVDLRKVGLWNNATEELKRLIQAEQLTGEEYEALAKFCQNQSLKFEHLELGLRVRHAAEGLAQVILGS